MNVEKIWAMMTTENAIANCAGLYYREMAHRTANVLQRAIAAVHLCRRGNPDHLDEAMICLRGAADLHILLSEQGSEPVDLGDRIRLAAMATASACGAPSIEFEFDLPRIVTAPSHARHVSMVICELVSNSIRHAFAGGPGTVLVSISDDSKRTLLRVRDDGRCSRWLRDGGQGHGIVDALATSLGGVVRRKRTKSGSAVVDVVVPSIALLAGAVAGSA